ncbi:MAG: 2-C-methyl-D-erythritol 4-phosphate cytidylyltransferase [Clostridia bacterium]|nr:2-C-methyl-D-erythritol 4-phosphate cytidylyltransferase [Clostridia bacterium]
MKNIFSQLSEKFNLSHNADTSAILLCAGESTRFSGGRSSKQMASVLGKAVIARTIEAFEESPSIKEIVLVVKKEETDDYNKLICNSVYKKISCIVVGGDTRQISAMRGFKHISEKSKLVAIHDGARCLVTPEIIEAVISEARSNGAASSANKVTDTVKIVDDDKNISRTVSRENMWTVQTPQVFEHQLYRNCIENAKEKGIGATDDCMLAEAYGQKVKLVETGRENIKITYKEDILLAEAIIKARGDK